MSRLRSATHPNIRKRPKKHVGTHEVVMISWSPDMAPVVMKVSGPEGI